MHNERIDRLAPRGPAAEGTPGSSAAEYFRYTIGDAEVTAIHDGHADMPLDGLVRNVPFAEVKAAWAAASGTSGDMFRIPFTSIVIELAGKSIVLDTSYGGMGPPTAGRWMDNFIAAGFDPGKIDMVVFSHFHPDHINGYRRKDGTSPFTRAEVLVPASEWDYWMDEGRRAGATGELKETFENVHRVFDPIKDGVKTFGPGEEIVSGLTAIAVPGHTPGHTAFSLTSKGETLIVLSDTSNNPVLLAPRPDFQLGFDMDGEQTARSRMKMFQHAVDEKAQVAFFHAPFPATGHLIAEGKGFRFVPLA